MKNNTWKILITVLGTVLILSILALLLGEFLDSVLDVIGIRIAVLIVAFASLGSSTMFSLLVYTHNKTVSKINDDSNLRAEAFRELQFASSNYSIIEFRDRMLIQGEKKRYIKRLTAGKIPSFHMIEEYEGNYHINDDDEFDNYNYYTIRIPFNVIEGKMVSKITLNKIHFERDDQIYLFHPFQTEEEAQAYILYNEYTKRNNLIINVAVNKLSEFFKEDKLNHFTKIKIYLNITSLLGVKVKGLNELYFTNPDQSEGDGLHSYHINSSNFTLLQRPMIDDFDYETINIKKL